MSLITPDAGLLFWMVLIFGIVFFLLWKFGFPVITEMVEKRSARIDESLRQAREIEQRMADWERRQAEELEKTRREQAAILKDAAVKGEKLIADARDKAAAEAGEILSKAREEIAAEKESALRDVRREVAVLSMQVAEKVLRRELSDEGSQRELIDRMVDEVSQARN